MGAPFFGLKQPQRDKIISNFEKGRLPLLSSTTENDWKFLMHALEEHHKNVAVQSWITNHTFGGQVPVVSITLAAKAGEWVTLMGEIYYILWKKYKEGMKASWVENLMLRVRTMAAGQIPTSQVTLSFDVGTKFSTGLNAPTVSLIPDPNLGVTFGSTPDHVQIESQAPNWKKLRKRPLEDKTGKLYKGTHYVLAHMLNDNLNGSGADSHNVMPYWATANKDMAKKVENAVKECVLRGFEVEYKIVAGPEYGLLHRQPVLDDILKKAGKTAKNQLTGNELLQYEIVELEQYLATNLVIDARVKDQGGTWHVIVNKIQIDNYVPLSIPVL